jgi:hypothetical protein
LNVLVVASESGNTYVRLNGVNIVTADPSAWTPTDPAEVYLGTVNTLGNRFDGELDGFYAFDLKLSPIQADDLAIMLLGR